MRADRADPGASGLCSSNPGDGGSSAYVQHLQPRIHTRTSNDAGRRFAEGHADQLPRGSTSIIQYLPLPSDHRRSRTICGAPVRLPLSLPSSPCPRRHGHGGWPPRSRGPRKRPPTGAAPIIIDINNVLSGSQHVGPSNLPERRGGLSVYPTGDPAARIPLSKDDRLTDPRREPDDSGERATPTGLVASPSAYVLSRMAGSADTYHRDVQLREGWVRTPRGPCLRAVLRIRATQSPAHSRGASRGDPSTRASDMLPTEQGDTHLSSR